jgi:hypothetical protein
MSFYIPEKKSETSHENSTSENSGTNVTSDNRQPEYLTVTSKSQSTRNSTIILVVFFIIGLISIFIGIKKTTPATAAAAISDEDLQLEASIAAITGIKTKMNDQMDDIMKKFSEFSNVRQVEVNQLVKNPFSRQSGWGAANNEEEPADKSGNLQEQELKFIAKNMQLLSIMESKNSPEQTCCMIDDKILYKGESIKGFTISAITESSVKLQAGTLEIELKLR